MKSNRSSIAAVRARLLPGFQSLRNIGATGSWSVLGAFLSSVLTLGTMILFARILGRVELGKLTLIQSTISALAVLAVAGTGTTVTRFAAALKRTDPIRLERVIALTEVLVVCASTIIGATLAASVIFFNVKLFPPGIDTPVVVIASLLLATNAIDAYQKCALVGLDGVREATKGSFIAGALGAPPSIYFAINYGLFGAAIGLALSSIFQCIVGRYYIALKLLQFGLSPRYSECLSEIGVFKSCALPSLISSSLIAPAHWFAQSSLAHGPGGYAQVALLGVGMQWFTMVSYIPNAFGRVILPTLSEKVEAEGVKGVMGLMKAITIANSLVALLCCGLVVMISPLFPHLYGAQFSSSAQVISIMALAAFLSVACAPFGQLLIASERNWIGVVLNLVWAIVYIACVQQLQLHGALGAAAALAVAYGVHGLTTSLAALNANHRFIDTPRA